MQREVWLTWLKKSSGQGRVHSEGKRISLGEEDEGPTCSKRNRGSATRDKKKKDRKLSEGEKAHGEALKTG